MIDADLVLLALGFTGPVKQGMVEQFGVELDARGNIATKGNYMSSVPGIFAAGDMRRGPVARRLGHRRRPQRRQSDRPIPLPRGISGHTELLTEIPSLPDSA